MLNEENKDIPMAQAVDTSDPPKTATPVQPAGTNVNATIGNAAGVAIRQQTQAGEAVAQALGVPLESANKYKVSVLPDGKKVGKSSSDSERWQPSNKDLLELDELLFVQEESSFCNRMLLNFCGCGNLRQLKLHFTINNRTQEAFVVDRPFKCGGCCFMPQEMSLSSRNNQGDLIPLGMIKENFDPYISKFLACCFSCTGYHDVFELNGEGNGLKPIYTIRANMCCCGGSGNNCCGSTCFRNDLVFDILDREGNVVANLQRTYASGADGGGCKALCRMCNMFSNYLLSFPPDSTPQQRMLLLAAVFQIEYYHFEKEGGD